MNVNCTKHWVRRLWNPHRAFKRLVNLHNVPEVISISKKNVVKKLLNFENMLKTLFILLFHLMLSSYILFVESRSMPLFKGDKHFFGTCEKVQNVMVTLSII